MARLGRSYARSNLRPPIVIGAAVTFRPLQITLSVRLRTREQPPQRDVHSKLRPPTVVGPPITFGPVKTTLAPSPRLARETHSFRGALPPPVAAVPDLPLPMRVVRAVSTRLGRRARSVIQPAAVVNPAVTFGPVRVALAASSRLARKARSKLQSPSVVAPPVVYSAIERTLAPSSRLARRTHSFRTALPPPTVVVTPPLPIPLRIVLAASSRLARRTHSFRTALPPPAVIVAPLPAPLRVVLAASSRIARLARSRLKPPTVVAPAVTYAPVKITLADSPRQPHYRTHSFATAVPLAAPVPPPTREQLTTRVWLTKRGPQRLTSSRLRPPTVVARPVLPEQQRVRITLVPSPKQGRAAHSILRPPTVLAIFTTSPFGSPSPAAAGLAGVAMANMFSGLPDSLELDAAAPGADHEFAPPRPRRAS